MVAPSRLFYPIALLPYGALTLRRCYLAALLSAIGRCQRSTFDCRGFDAVAAADTVTAQFENLFASISVRALAR